MTNAVIQDAFLGRGTKSPMLTVLNFMGLQTDETAPQSVSDEVMEMIGPSRAVAMLEHEVQQTRNRLSESYGRPSRAPADEQSMYYTLQQQLRCARQHHRRKVLKLMTEDHFKQRNEDELQNQLHGIHKPLQMRKIVHSLPQRNEIAELLGDLDDDLPEDEIVRRKIDAINAMVAYAFVREPLQRVARQHQQVMLKSDENLQHATYLGQCIASKSAAHTPEIMATTLPTSPPPPYASIEPQQPLVLSVTPKRKPRASPPCIFCGKKYTRMGALWDHLEAHLDRVKDGWVKCPACSIVCNTPTAFMAHAARTHKIIFRRPRVKLVQKQP